MARAAAGAGVSQALHDIEVGSLRDQLVDLGDTYKETLQLLQASQRQLHTLLGLRQSVAGVPLKQFKIKANGKKGESVAVLVASDWHLEERVDPATIDGVNEFSPAIAERRLGKFFEHGLSLIDMTRGRSHIEVLVLAVLGDLITNTLHEDLAESNYLSPTEATLKAYRVLCGGIDFLLKEGGFKKIIIPCNHGNHGRTTKKMRIATAAKNSYEWLLYQLAAEHFQHEPRVHFQIADGYFNFLEVYDTTLRLHHGDGVRYQGGVGGLTIPLNKAIAQWNGMRRVDIDVLGHWHTRLSGRGCVVNGSVIGYNAYAVSIKASYEPPSQSFFLIHPERGKTVEAPIFLE